MGIYYFAINHDAKEYFTSPKGWPNRIYSMLSMDNPFCGMYAMQCSMNFAPFKLTNDIETSIPDDYEDITDELYKLYCTEYGFKDKKGIHREVEYPAIDEIIINRNAMTIYVSDESNNFRIDVLVENERIMLDSLSIQKRYEEDTI